MANEREESLLNSKRKKAFSRIASHAHDELHSFRIWLKWLCVDQSNAWTTCLSWFVFLVLAILVPALSHFVLACSDCDSRHSRPYDTVVQLSLSGVAALSFICLSYFVRKFGLRRFLFLDKLCNESEAVSKGYTEQLNVRLFSLFTNLSVSLLVFCEKNWLSLLISAQILRFHMIFGGYDDLAGEL